jgi:hypothetical protein
LRRFASSCFSDAIIHLPIAIEQTKIGLRRGLPVTY